MKRAFRFAIFLASATLFTSAAIAAPMATIFTSLGAIVIQLDREHAPATVDNFVRYAMEGHFDGTVFYRVVPGFVIQAGSYDEMGKGRPVHDPVMLETANVGSNLRGTIAMGRSDDPNSATAEFFINLADNRGLDRQPDDMENKTGFAPFGRVIGGMDAVNAISRVPVGGGVGPFGDAAPVTPVIIRKVMITDN